MLPAIALLIDGDQTPTQGLVGLLATLEKKWTVSERIVVRNYRSTRDLQEWRAFSDEYGFRCIQRDPVATGKNAADIELAVITVDLLRDGARAFCLVTGDMDFTPVVQRIKRGGAHVEWVRPQDLAGYKKASRGRGAQKPTAGKKAAPRTARKATAPAPPKAARPAAKPTPAPASAAKKPPRPAKGRQPRGGQDDADTKGYAKAVRRAISQLRKAGSHEQGWVSVNRIGSILAEEKVHKEDFGFAKRRALYEVLEACGFKTEQLETGAYRVTLD